MSRRRRALLLGAAALACAGLAAAMASGYRSDVASQLGALRPVLVAGRALPAHEALSAQVVRGSLEVRRVPARFAPPGALSSPRQALGQVPMAPVPAGGYLLGAQLRPPGSRTGPSAPTGVGPGRSPVEIAVSGAAALAASSGDPIGERVDVVVTTEPRGAAARGRTYVAASQIRLVDLRQAGASDPAPGVASPIGAGGWTATLALTRHQALKLIEAESYAREIRLIGGA
jgi:Flp pilus assembly protein CpaB